MNLHTMTRRLLGKADAGQVVLVGRGETISPEKVSYAYRIYWAKTARQWDAARRERVAGALREVTARPEFETNLIERRYEVSALEDSLAHSGASLEALAEVLAALDAHEASSPD